MGLRYKLWSVKMAVAKHLRQDACYSEFDKSKKLLCWHCYLSCGGLLENVVEEAHPEAKSYISEYNSS